MELSTAFREVKSLDVAKDKRTSRRGQITKVKAKLAEFKNKQVDDVPLATPKLVVQTKLKKDVHLHEAIQQRFQELLAKGSASAP